MSTSRRIILIVISAVLLTAIVVFFWRLEVDPATYFTGTWMLAVLMLLGLGNRFITIQFDRYFPWLSFGNRRFFIHLVLGILYSLIIINLAYITFKILFTKEVPTPEQFIVMNAYGVVIFIPIFSIYFSLQFLQHWKVSELNAERFKQENLKSQLDALKSHLDPHFLFNNLNILASLIDQDRAQSKVFLHNFSDVYRAILRAKDEDLITLEDELTFIDAYMLLIKTRFEDLIIFEKHIPVEAHYKMIPPLTLQLLVENAIKHNIVTERKPLTIEFFIEGECLVVKNSINLKPETQGNTSGSGLKNISKRYAYFTDRKVEVNRDHEIFSVSVPLLEVDTI